MKRKITATLLIALLMVNITIGNVKGAVSEKTESPEYEMALDNTEQKEDVTEEIATDGDATPEDATADDLEVEADTTKIALTAENFPDKNFRDYLADNFDMDGDGYIVIEYVQDIYIHDMDVDLTGIEYFTNLTKLNCRDTNLGSLDVSKNINLTELNCSNANLTSLDVSHNVNLTSLYCWSWENSDTPNHIDRLDVSSNKKLHALLCEGSDLNTLILGELPELSAVDCSYNNLSELRVNNCGTLIDLDCANNRLETLEINGSPGLLKLDCSVNELESLDITATSKLEQIDCSDNHLGDAAFLRECPQLIKFDCQWNEIRAMDLSGCLQLERLICSYNRLLTLDVSNNTRLKTLNCSKNPLRSLTLGQNTALELLYCYQGQLTNIDVGGCTALRDFKCWGNRLTELSFNNPGLRYCSCDNNQLTTLRLEEAPNLSYLRCEDNQLKALDLSKNSSIYKIDCSRNNLESLNLDNVTNLNILDCANNRLTELDLSDNTSLTNLDCDYNLLTNLDISKNRALEKLSCQGNYLTELDTGKNPGLADYKFSTDSQYSVHSADISGIYVHKMDETGVVAGAVLTPDSDDKRYLEFAWYASKDDGRTWTVAQDWTTGNEWLLWQPDEFGEYILVCKVRATNGMGEIRHFAVNVSFHPAIKGICQMPYEGEGGGYLIGIESFDNPGRQYRYEMLILDCTLLAEGKDAWVYTTGKCSVPENCLWTVWQPQYGYYWTLFRIYDGSGRLIDERCYGFANVIPGDVRAAVGAGSMDLQTKSVMEADTEAAVVEETVMESEAAVGAHVHDWIDCGRHFRYGDGCRCNTDVEWTYFAYDDCGGWGSFDWTVAPSYKECTICGEKIHEHTWKKDDKVYRATSGLAPLKDRNYYYCPGCCNQSIDGYTVDYYNNYGSDGFDFRDTDIRETVGSTDAAN